MSATSYYDQAASQETSHFGPTSGQQSGPMHSGTQGYGQDMRQDMNEQQQHGFPQQQSGNGVYNGQEPNMGNTNYAQGAQQMNGGNNYAQGAQQMEGHGAQGAVADDRDFLTKCNDNPPDYKNINLRKCHFNESIFQHAVKWSVCTRWLATDRRSTNIPYLTSCACVYDSTWQNWKEVRWRSLQQPRERREEQGAEWKHSQESQASDGNGDVSTVNI